MFELFLGVCCLVLVVPIAALFISIIVESLKDRKSNN
jgi:hypothetical protein